MLSPCSCRIVGSDCCVAWTLVLVTRLTVSVAAPGQGHPGDGPGPVDKEIPKMMKLSEFSGKSTLWKSSVQNRVAGK